jgi:predicted phage tail protein
MFSENKVKIILHGYLKQLHPGELILSGRTVAEIINGMCKTTKAFNVGPTEEKHVISVLGFEKKESLYEPIDPELKELHMVPAMVGGKSGGFIKIVIGAVLIAASFIPGLNFLLPIGISMVLGGVLELLTPQPRADTFGNGEADPEASKYLGATQNTVKIGTRIPLLYGEMKAYGHYLSFDVDAKDIAV